MNEIDMDSHKISVTNSEMSQQISPRRKKSDGTSRAACSIGQQSAPNLFSLSTVNGESFANKTNDYLLGIPNSNASKMNFLKMQPGKYRSTECNVIMTAMIKHIDEKHKDDEGHVANVKPVLHRQSTRNQIKAAVQMKKRESQQYEEYYHSNIHTTDAQMGKKSKEDAEEHADEAVMEFIETNKRLKRMAAQHAWRVLRRHVMDIVWEKRSKRLKKSFNWLILIQHLGNIENPLKGRRDLYDKYLNKPNIWLEKFKTKLPPEYVERNTRTEQWVRRVQSAHASRSIRLYAGKTIPNTSQFIGFSTTPNRSKPFRAIHNLSQTKQNLAGKLDDLTGDQHTHSHSSMATITPRSLNSNHLGQSSPMAKYIKGKRPKQPRKITKWKLLIQNRKAPLTVEPLPQW